MLPHKKTQRSWIGNDVQQKLLGPKYPITTDVVIGRVLAHNNRNGNLTKTTNMERKCIASQTKQQILGHQPATAWNPRQETENSDAVGIDFHPHELIDFGWLSAHSNNYRICMGKASSGRGMVFG